eukprot:14299235-Ditylum_brightwellii.AAC.1
MELKDPNVIYHLYHVMTAIHHCLYKDRSFDDPLLSLEEEEEKRRKKGGGGGKEEDDCGGGVEVSTLVENGNEPDELHYTENNEEEDYEEDETEKEARKSLTLLNEQLLEDAESEEEGTKTPPPQRNANSPIPPPSIKKPKKKRQSKNGVKIDLGGGFVIHDKLTLSLSVHHFCIRAMYNTGKKERKEERCEECDYVQMTFKGGNMLIEKGGYAQFSMSYLSIQEHCRNLNKSLLYGGIKQHDIVEDAIDLEMTTSPKKKKKYVDVTTDETFPLFEPRSIREDPIGLRHSFPLQAVGVKTTVDYLKVGGDNDDDDDDDDALEKVENMVGGGIDARWSSGDWSDCITTEMLVTPCEILKLDHHIQPIPEFVLDENSMLSSDLFNVTARIVEFDIRVPAPVHKDVRSSDVVVSLEDMMFIVSAALPRSFLTGRICGLSNRNMTMEDIEFPHDASDICYSTNFEVDEISKLSLKHSTFRVQCNMSGFRVQAIPVLPFCNAVEPQTIIAPTKFTAIMSFDGQVPVE